MNQNEQSKQIRIKYGEILNRVWEDTDLSKKFSENPVEVLKEYGFPIKEGANYHSVAPEEVKPSTDTDIYLPFVPKPESKELVEKARKAVPDAKVIVHPECRHEIVEMSDGKGSTEYLIKAVKEAESGTKWIIGTESNLVERIKHDNPDKSVYLLDPHSICKNMNKTSTENVLDTLEGILKSDFSKQITVDKQTAADAIKSLNTMLSLS